MDENGSGERQRVRFGDGPAQEIPAEWVEAMLRWLFAHNKQAFAGALHAAIDLHLPGRGRKPKVGTDAS